jgi:hypothetical protein
MQRQRQAHDSQGRPHDPRGISACSSRKAENPSRTSRRPGDGLALPSLCAIHSCSIAIASCLLVIIH